MTPNTEEYLRGFLPLCFSASMDAMTEEALAEGYHACRSGWDCRIPAEYDLVWVE